MIPAAVHQQTLLAAFSSLKPLLEDPNVSEILVNGPKEVFYEERGRLKKSRAEFPSAATFEAALRNLAQFVGRPLSPECPILEGHLPDGSRVEAIIPPASPDGPMMSIRRFPRQRLTMESLIRRGTVDLGTARQLEDLVKARRNILVAGGTGSGKTSLLTALSSFVDPSERMVLLEDARELQLSVPHVVRLLTCPGDARGRGRVTMRDLLRAALRMRPDRIVLGEVRGEEAVDLVQAMNTGHGGCLSTVHASHPEGALRRLEAMALLGGVEIPLPALRAQIASAIGVIVQMARLDDGKRIVTHVTEVFGADAGSGYQIRHVYGSDT